MTQAALAEDRALIADVLGTDQLDPLLDLCTPVQLTDGEVLMRDRGEIDAMYMLLDGMLEVQVEVAGHAILLGTIRPGNWVGEVAYYSRCGTACSSVAAVGDCRLMRLRFTDYAALQQEQSEVACRLSHVLISMLAQRLRATVNDPILDPEGRLLMLGDLSLPVDRQVRHHSGVADFFRNLLGLR